ncbi:MAG: flagellar basal body P-ring formation chaperone FlgA [Phenylobacterium sp.]|uniref:flagellar basal body P-ring formation chaperone FlgA n=1 Tax=Phenylobacterium sp. TaxID=1871053 RepID=UPI0039192EF7
MKRLLILAAAAALLAHPALAGQAVTLKAETIDHDGIVTLGDLFDGAGAAGKTPLAARPGASVILDAAAVQAAARRAGLDWANAEGLRKIVVRGAASMGSAAPASAVAARGNVEVLTYARSLSAGEVVRPEDLIWARAAAAPNDAPRDADAVIGLAARRPLRAGAAVSSRDVSAPAVIKTGDMVTVVYRDGGISLSLQAKALGGAGIGETLSVQNLSSKKTLQAVATGPGEAAVGPAAEALKAAARQQYALR